VVRADDPQDVGEVEGLVVQLIAVEVQAVVSHTEDLAPEPLPGDDLDPVRSVVGTQGHLRRRRRLFRGRGAGHAVHRDLILHEAGDPPA